MTYVMKWKASCQLSCWIESYDYDLEIELKLNRLNILIKIHKMDPCHQSLFAWCGLVVLKVNKLTGH